MSFDIIRGDALHLPLEDASVDLVVTSPPYFGLRSYQDAGEHYTGQLGSEATPAEFVDALLAATAEMVRVLKPSGSIFVNLGDKYATAGTRQGNGDGLHEYGQDRTEQARHYMPKPLGIPTKSLIGIPWRYALRCIDDLGLILRAEIIWAKPNGLPESVTDRVRRSHEQWFHFTVRPRYYSAVDEIRETHIAAPSGNTRPAPGKGQRDSIIGGRAAGMAETWIPGQPNPLGKLPGSVWTVPTQPLTVPAHLGVDHFAAFPMEFPRRIIRGWSPPGVCTGCGEGRRPVVTAEYVDAGGRGNEKWDRVEQGSGDYVFGSFKPQEMRLGRANRTTTINGYTCACACRCGHTTLMHGVDGCSACEVFNKTPCSVSRPAALPPTTPAVVLDPFGGTGTTALVAHALGRHGISVDMSADYCRLAEWRCNDRGQLAAALEVDKPAAVPEGQLDIFGGVA